MNKLEQAARQLLSVLENGMIDINAVTALREALDHSGEANEMVIDWDKVKPEAIASDPLYQQGYLVGYEAGLVFANARDKAEQADVKESFTTQFIPVGIVNDQHCITWMEEIVDDQAPIGAILYAKEQL